MAPHRSFLMSCQYHSGMSPQDHVLSREKPLQKCPPKLYRNGDLWRHHSNSLELKLHDKCTMYKFIKLLPYGIPLFCNKTGRDVSMYTIYGHNISGFCVAPKSPSWFTLYDSVLGKRVLMYWEILGKYGKS